MARPDQEKCRLCSKLSSQEAQQRHGTDGDGCWNPNYCHNRRSYYRNRGVRNHNRKQQRSVQQDSSTTTGTGIVVLHIPAPAVPAAVVYWYRERKDAPLHAIGAALWLGNTQTARIEPIHCLGLTEAQIKTLLLRILEGFSTQCGTKLERYRSMVELHPANCPIRPCPLHG